MKEKARTGESTLYDALVLLQEELGRLNDGQAAPSAFEAYADARAAKTTAALAEEAHKALAQDEEERRTLAQLRDRVHAAAAKPIEAAPAATVPVEAPAVPPEVDHTVEEALLAPLGSQRAAFSRFQSDFVDQAKIGAGGFGSVVRVKNRVDGLVYAVKVVVLSDDPSENRKLLREVSTLSVLNHPNVVRYYQAWIEESYESRHAPDSEGGSDSTPALTSEVSETVPLRTAPGRGVRGGGGAAPDWIGTDTSHSDRLKARGRRQARARQAGVRPSPVVEGTPSTPTSPPPAMMLPPRHATTAPVVATAEEGDDSSSWASTASDAAGSEDDSSTTDSDDEDDAPGTTPDDSDTDDVLAGLRGGLQMDELVGGPVRRRKAAPPPPRSYAIHALATPSSDLFERGEGVESSAYSTDFMPAAQPAAASARVRVRRLYIQMEYCQGTLRTLIDRSSTQSGGLPLAERWKLTRQLLDALAYIHGRGILHRDIKPANILLDAEGNVKLGDFGLAVEQQLKGRPPPASGEAIVSVVAESLAQLGASISAGVGTTLYRAPEVATGVKYDAKADMFSLGVVLFELFYRPLSTGMERSVVIMRMREHEGRETGWPADYADVVPTGARSVISMLLHMDAKLRPSTEDVLNTSLLPDRGEVETRYMDEAARALTQPHSAFMEKLLKRIFARPTQDFVDLSFDADAADTRLHVAAEGALTDSALKPFDSLPYTLEASAVSFVRKLIASVCERHAAVAFDVPSLLPRPAVLAGYAGIALRRIGASAVLQTDFGALLPELALLLQPGAATRAGGASALTAQLLSHFAHVMSSLSAPAFSPIGVSAHVSDTARQSALLVDRGGVIVQLPHDTAHVFARWLARAHVHAFKRYCVTRVYRPREAGKQPREVTEAAMDICAPCPTNLLQAWLASGAVDAETIFTACEVCVAAHGSATAAHAAYFVRLNNSKIISGICDLLCLSPAAATALSRLMTACAALTQALEGHDAAAKAHSRRGSAAKHAPSGGATERVRDGVLSWPDIRAYVVAALDVSQHTADLLRPVLLPAAAGMDAMLAGVEEMLKRQRTPLLKKLSDSLSAHATGATDDKQQLARQLRGMMLMYQGVAR